MHAYCDEAALLLGCDTRYFGKSTHVVRRYDYQLRQAFLKGDPSGFVLDLQVYYLLATVYSRLGEHELARQYAELSKTAAVPIQDRARN